MVVVATNLLVRRSACESLVFAVREPLNIDHMMCVS